ncbi:3-methyl-2-oxobutanoate hydroxymethyltransferase [Thermodesulfobacterium hydrogeniphilum]|uniref:3-methyl-2-oxobutanoate hydroxymethyltransferase n=1 Tax=Thermodesulfobacterium hydrogeniphilum TaxID=161156 RepID=UPI00056FADF7|nr:3-methyl-2-oxobutanoate hydroxymethyltransferase [Thermodesulfobacterium hydrogeniphilum]
MSLFKLSPNSLKEKKGKESIVAITAYDYISAKLAEESKMDFILIGDSGAMVVLGHEDTYSIGMEEMLMFCKAVSRGAPNTLRIGDMPFLSYQVSKEQAILNAGRFVKEGRCHGVKVEGGEETAETIQAIVKAGIPVLGHIGLTPQRSMELGGLKVQGKTIESAQKLLNDAIALEEAGVFAIILECVPSELSKIITEKIKVPTIGIGAGPFTDGQILVFHDVVGLFPEMRPKFVKTYCNGFETFKKALCEYVKDCKEKKFPSEKESFKISKEALEAVLNKT